LAAGLPDAAADGERAALEAAVAAADARVAAVRRVLTEVLTDEAVAAAAPELLGRVAVLARTAPGAFDGRQDLTHLAGLLARATAPADGPLGRWRARRADRRLRRALGAPAEASAGELGTALELARVQRTAARL